MHANYRLPIGIGHCAIFFIFNGVLILAQPYYQMDLGMDPFLLSLATTIPMLISLLFAPWTGWYSDHFQHKLGRRRPFILVSSIACGVLYGLIWQAPTDWPETIQFIYIFVCCSLFYITSNFLVIPLRCLTLESTNDVSERTKIIAVSDLFNKICSVLYQWAYPLSQLSLFGGAVIGVKTVGWGIGIVFILLAGLISAIFTQEVETPSETKKSPIPLLKSLKTTLSNQIFRRVLLLTFFSMGGIAFAATFDFYLLVYLVANGDLQLGAELKGILSSSHAIMGMLSIPIVTQLTLKFGSHKTLQLILLLTLLSGVAKWFLFVPGAGYLIALDAILANPIWVAVGIILPAMIGEICDQQAKNNQADQKGMYTAVHQWVIYISGSLALIFSGAVLNWINFDAKLQAQQSEQTLFYMRCLLSFGTCFFALVALLFNRKRLNRNSLSQTD